MPAREQASAGQVLVAASPQPPSGPDAPARSPASSQPWRSHPIALAAGACVVLAALSALLLPTVPSYDPWSWVVWGREVFDPHLSFATGGGPSWKPLPVVFTALYGPLGGAAPKLWVLTARVGGLLALVGAARLGWRLGGGLPGAGDDRDGRSGRAARGIAAAVAVLGVLLTQDFFYYMFRGTSEPALIATALWSVDRFLAGRHGQAFAVAVAGSLIRPEWWPFLGLYALWLWFREPRLRLLIVTGLALVPLGWFVPPWIGSGQPFLAASHAKSYNGHLGSHPVLEALRRAGDLQVLPVLIAAAVAVALTATRERDRLTLGLAGAALAWIALVVGMVVLGYPGLERFFLPAAALLCVLGGLGVARVALLAGARLRPGPGVAVGLALVLVAVSVPLCSARISSARAQQAIADRAVHRLDQLSAAVAAVGGHHGVYPCHSSFAAINHGVQTALAWKLHVTLGRVGTAMRHAGVLFVGPHDSIDGGPAPISPRLTSVQLIAQVGVWKVYRVTRPGASLHCVGR